jgi:hypothetical protein
MKFSTLAGIAGRALAVLSTTNAIARAKRCVSMDNGAVTPSESNRRYVATLAKVCDKPQSCKVKMFVTDVNGIHVGERTLSLAAGSAVRPSAAQYGAKIGVTPGTSAQLAFNRR